MALDDDIRQLATGRNLGALSTILPDGQPQTHVMWVDADTTHLMVNTELGRAKLRNVERDPRVTLTIWDADDPYRYAEVRGHVDEVVGGAAAREHIDACSYRYRDAPYPPDKIRTERVILRIAPDRIVRRNI